MAPHEKNENVKVQNVNAGIPTGVENMWGAVSFPLVRGALQNLMEARRGLKSIHGGSMGWRLKMLLKNTCEGVHLIVKLPAISLQA